MTDLALIANLFAYTIVVSQPLLYVVALTEAQLALSAPAYIELRQRINPPMTKRLPVIYLGTLATGVWVLVVALQNGERGVLVATAVALFCLVVDVVFMMRENVPINGVIDRWSTTDFPADWEEYRVKWFRIFRYRQVALLVGFASLVIGSVVR